MASRLMMLVALGAALSVSGCVTPILGAANGRGGEIAHVNGLDEDAAFRLADEHCHKYGRVAQITGTDAIYNRAHFACVEG